MNIKETAAGLPDAQWSSGARARSRESAVTAGDTCRKVRSTPFMRMFYISSERIVA
jgi:hypothetical protein